jgi:hypothetical protein
MTLAEPIAPIRRTATDRVPLGKTGAYVSRIGIGTGTDAGHVQREMGQERFTYLIRYAYDLGINLVDTADMYRTHEMVGTAIKGLPRESLFIQTKMQWDAPTIPAKPLEVLDRYLHELGVDYVDSLLIHCTTQPTWDTDLRCMMDAYDQAQEQGKIRFKGVSCHGLPALRRATLVDWVEIQLARINPFGKHLDGKDGSWDEAGDIPAVVAELKAMHAQGRGMIAMKLIGNGNFRDPNVRRESVEFVMGCEFVDAAIAGFGSIEELDETLGNANRALAR